MALHNIDVDCQKALASSTEGLLCGCGYGVVCFEQGVGNEMLFLSEFVAREDDYYRQGRHRNIHDTGKLGAKEIMYIL